jgi:hypothetical protein
MSKRIDNFSGPGFIYNKGLNGLDSPEYYSNHAIISYEVSSGTAGYTTATAAWTPVLLNTVTNDQTGYSDFVSLHTAGGHFALQPGVYLIRGYTILGSFTDANVKTGKMRLYNLHMYFLGMLTNYRPTIDRFETYVTGASGSLAPYMSSLSSIDEIYSTFHIYRMANPAGALSV